MFALSSADHWGQEHDFRPLGQPHQLILYLSTRLLLYWIAAAVAVGAANACDEQPEEIVDFRDGGDRTSRIRSPGPLVDADCRLQTLDQVDVGTLHHLEKLTCIN